MEKAELKKLVSEDIEKAFTELGRILLENNDLYNKLILFRSRYNNRKWDVLMGILKQEDWGLECNNITLGLIELIDKIEKPNENNNSNTINKKEIVIKDAIEWLENVFTEQTHIRELEFFVEETGEQVNSYNQWVILKVNIESDGRFLIIESYEAKESVYDTFDKTSLDIFKQNRILKEISGNVCDIGKVEVLTDHGEKVCKIKFLATNFRRCFYMKSNEIFGNEKITVTIDNKEEISLVHEFILYIKDSELSKRIKNAIDYLAIHFGRKEDAF